MIGGRGEDDPPHSKTLITEDCIESAHRTLNARRRDGPPPLPTLVRDFRGELPRSLSHPEARSHEWLILVPRYSLHEYAAERETLSLENSSKYELKC